MIDITSFFHDNPILGGGAVLAGAGSFIAWAKDGPSKVVNKLKQFCVTTVTVDSDNHIYNYVDRWLSAQTYVRKARNVRATLETIYDEHYKSKEVTVFKPNDGEHFLKYKSTWLWITVSRVKKEQSSDRKIFTISFLTRSRKDIESFFKDIEDLYIKGSGPRQYMFTNIGNMWNGLGWGPIRKLSSVILEDNLKETTIDDLSKFIKSHSLYSTLGLPYRRGYLLEGPPGNGKSSLIKAMAGYARRDLYVLELSDPMMTDAALVNLIGNISSGGILVLEDIDASFTGRGSKGSRGITFSGLLNALDGITSKEGVICIMTTNHPELLDPALIRPGRVDVRLHIGNASYSQAKELYLRFNPEDVSGAEAFSLKYGDGTYSMASLQGILLKDNPI